MRHISKQQRVLNHLLKGKTLTTLSAYRLCKATRLAALIYNIRKKGYDVITTMEGKGREKYARYSLRNAQKEETYFPRKIYNHIINKYKNESSRKI